MASGPEIVVRVELCAPSLHEPRWAELGCVVRTVGAGVIDACAAEPAALERQQRAEPGGLASTLAMVCDHLPAERIAEADWQNVLHEPLRRCFTALRGLVPCISAAARGGRIIAFLSSAAVLPDPAQGSAAVLGRALLGLFESLRAELGRSAIQVTICFTDPQEPAAAFHARLRRLLRDGPLYSMPASLERQAIEAYFDPLLAALARAPEGRPLPGVGPQGDLYETASAGSATP